LCTLRLFIIVNETNQPNTNTVVDGKLKVCVQHNFKHKKSLNDASMNQCVHLTYVSINSRKKTVWRYMWSLVAY